MGEKISGFWILIVYLRGGRGVDFSLYFVNVVMRYRWLYWFEG